MPCYGKMIEDADFSIDTIKKLIGQGEQETEKALIKRNT
jgi:hypothetical protein